MARAMCVGLVWGAVFLGAVAGCGSSKSSSCLTGEGIGGSAGGAAGGASPTGGGKGGGGKAGGAAGTTGGSAGGHGGTAVISNGGSAGGATPAGGGAGGASSHAGGSTGGGGAGGVHGDPCTLATTYVITGEIVDRNAQQMTLSPPATFQASLNRFPSQIQIAACAPPLPACHSAAAIDVSDVTAALDNADVQAAFTQSLMTQYQQAGDAAIQIRRVSDDHIIGEMTPCAAPACRPAPDGVRGFIALMKDLLKQQLADATCDGVRQP